jgi:hypothetical protein
MACIFVGLKEFFLQPVMLDLTQSSKGSQVITSVFNALGKNFT